jgi:hypothetical protein
MRLSSFVFSLRRFFRTSRLASAVGLAVTSTFFTNALSGEDAVVTNVGRFEIPFDVEAEPGRAVKGFAVLFGSRDGGTTWDQLQSVPASQQAFMFNAPRDGRYSFAIRVTDGDGNLPPQAMQGALPELDVIVDTAAPELKLDLYDSGPGKVLINWVCTDPSSDPSTLSIEYLDAADGRWKSAPFQPAANGQTVISMAVGSVVSVRASIEDLAGNRGEAASQFVSREVRSAPGPQNTAAVGMPAVPAVPLGPNPFGDTFAAPPALGPGMPMSVPSVPAASAGTATVVGTALAEGGGFWVNPASANSYPAISGSDRNAIPGVLGESALVNSPVFNLDYEVRDVGPSGVSSVELFVTEDGGQQWFRYDKDADLKSPFQVDTRGEGHFGFAVRVRNGLGFADPPPQPGQRPEILVTVDTTAPTIELVQPSIRAEGFGTIQLSWRINDAHPANASVRLEQSTLPNGPWTPVFDWQADQGGYQWAVRPGTPPALYFRLLARDAAGNVSTSQTPQPVVVDTRKPIGRLLRVQAVSSSATPSN